MARPWFPMYAADLLVDGDVARLTDSQFRELVMCWCRACLDGGIPSDPAEYARVMKCHRNHARFALDWLCDFFVKDPSKTDRLISLRMDRESRKYEEKVEKLRENGKLGAEAKKAIALAKAKQMDGELTTTTYSTKEKGIKTTPAKPERKQRTPKPASESLEEILQGGKGTPMWESYWQLVAIFGGQPKNHAPKTTAKQYAEAIAAGVDPKRIHTQAQIFRNGTSEMKYMPQLAKWLDGQGYLTPDLPKSTGVNHGTHHSPAHRAGVDAAYLEQVNARLANAAPQPELSDEEMLSLYGRPA